MEEGLQNSSHHVNVTNSNLDNVYELASSVCAVVLIVTAIFGIVGNSATIYVFTSPEMRRISINLFLTALAVFDGLIAVFGGAVFSVLGICMPLTNTHASRCDQATAIFTKYLYPIAMMAQTASIWTMILITVERFVAVCFPMKVRFVCTLRKAKISLAIVVVISVVYNIVRFFEYDLAAAESGEIDIVPDLRANETYALIYLLWLNFATHLVVPVAIMTILNAVVVLNLQNPQFNDRFRKTRLTARVKEQQVTWMMIAITAEFLACNTLSFALNLIETTGNLSSMDERLFYFLSDFNNLLTECNSAFNCIIYYRFCMKYRRRCRKLFRCFWTGNDALMMGMIQTADLWADANERLCIRATDSPTKFKQLNSTKPFPKPYLNGIKTEALLLQVAKVNCLLS